MATQTGSEALDRMVERLGSTADPKRRYEYVLWLAKNSSPYQRRNKRMTYASEDASPKCLFVENLRMALCTGVAIPMP